MSRNGLLLLLTFLAPAVPATHADAHAPQTPPAAATFSIVAADLENGEWGVAVASRFLAVGSVVPWAEIGRGAMATQAVAEPAFAPAMFTLLERGTTAPVALNRVLGRDPRRATRQVGLVGPDGTAATYTGERCQEWAGGVSGDGYAIQGNLLVSQEVLHAMEDALLNTQGSLAERLLAALEAGDAAGGDRRGKQSAALLVVKEHGGYGGGNDRYIDLRVDDHPDPVTDLKRLYSLHARTFLPPVHVRLANAALEAGNRNLAAREDARAVYLYRQAIRDFPDDPDLKNALAWFYVGRRINMTEAHTLAQEALAAQPESWEVLDTLAEIHFARGDLELANDFSKRALATDPQNGYLRQQVDRFQAAVEKAEMRR